MPTMFHSLGLGHHIHVEIGRYNVREDEEVIDGIGASLNLLRRVERNLVPVPGRSPELFPMFILGVSETRVP